jgi:hypothetical protein
MIPTKKVIALMENQLALLRTLDNAGRDVAGYAVIVPPEGDPITFINISSQDDALSFYKYLADKLTASRENSGFGAIKTGR